jgi:hypothetical protein
VKAGIGTLSQLATAEDLRGRGIGAYLICVAEGRMRGRGVRAAELGVEDDNPRARALYKRLGYREVGSESASWNVEDADGNLVMYETELAVLRKDLWRREAAEHAGRAGVGSAAKEWSRWRLGRAASTVGALRARVRCCRYPEACPRRGCCGWCRRIRIGRPWLAMCRTALSFRAFGRLSGADS